MPTSVIACRRPRTNRETQHDLAVFCGQHFPTYAASPGRGPIQP
jgi:hypothetical protein